MATFNNQTSNLTTVTNILGSICQEIYESSQVTAIDDDDDQGKALGE